MDINESPLYVLLNPSINHAQKDLPISIYESGVYILFVILLILCHITSLSPFWVKDNIFYTESSTTALIIVLTISQIILGFMPCETVIHKLCRNSN